MYMDPLLKLFSRERSRVEKLNYETIQKYQSFNSIEELDQSVRGFLYKHKAELSEGTLSVLQLIWTHSVKVIGVSFAKYEYIAEQVKVSRRTVIRAVKVLVEKGIIKKVPTARMNGKQGVNLLVIQAYEPIDSLLNNNESPQDVIPSVTPNKTENKQSSLCEKKIKPNNVKEQSAEPALTELDTSYLPESIPADFIEVTSPFFNAIDIYKLWNRVLLAYQKLNLSRTLDYFTDDIIHAFKQTVFAKKLGKIRKTFEGYFYQTLRNKLIVEVRRENRHKLYDFISGE